MFWCSNVLAPNVLYFMILAEVSKNHQIVYKLPPIQKRKFESVSLFQLGYFYSENIKKKTVFQNIVFSIRNPIQD